MVNIECGVENIINTLVTGAMFCKYGTIKRFKTVLSSGIVNFEKYLIKLMLNVVVCAIFSVANLL